MAHHIRITKENLPSLMGSIVAVVKPLQPLEEGFSTIHRLNRISPAFPGVHATVLLANMKEHQGNECFIRLVPGHDSVYVFPNIEEAERVREAARKAEIAILKRRCAFIRQLEGKA